MDIQGYVKYVEANWFIVIPAAVGYLNVAIAGTRAMGWNWLADQCLKVENAIQAMVSAALKGSAKTVLLGVLLLSATAQADVTSPLLDPITQNWSKFSPSEGVIYCVREHQVKNLSSVTIVKYQDNRFSWLKLNADVGFAPSDMIAGEIMYPLGNLSQLNITIPVVSQIDINVGYGYGALLNDGDRKSDGGPAITGTYKF